MTIFDMTIKQKSELIDKLKKQLQQIEDEKSKDTNKSINDYKKLWNLYLKGTEKISIPLFS